MYDTRYRILSGMLVSILLVATVAPCRGATAGAAGIDARPIVFEPEPVGDLHPKLRWIKTERVRALWGSGDLHEKYGETAKSKAQVIAEAGFNVAIIPMQNDPRNRSAVPGFEDVLPANIEAARKHGLSLWVKWRYGSDHQEPYHRYRAPHGKLAEKTCCPLDSRYIERHVGRWAVRVAEAGADGFVLDTEMYLSDVADYAGPCACDYCFREYLDEFARSSDTIYDAVEPADRGAWLREQGVYGHYSLFAARRIEDLYDSIRARCQAVNPAFLFGYAPTTEHVPGMTRGLGTSAVPCMVLGEAEYETGPTSLLQHDKRYLAQARVPGLYVCGLYVSKTSPQLMAERALIASLHGDGWWAYYGVALVSHVGPGAEKKALPGGYGRWGNSSADDYLSLLAKIHARVDELVDKPQDTWPPYPEHADMRPPPTGTVLWRQGGIKIDGVLDDEAWRSASRVEMFNDRYDKKNGPENVFWFCWDDDALYFAARCPIPTGTEISVEARGRDHPFAWPNDGVELFLDPTGNGARYAQIILSALGDTYESRIDFAPGTAASGNLDWNPRMTVGAAQTEAEYVIEVRIPFDDLLPAPRVGSSWRVNVCRGKPTVQTWSPTFGIFHNPPRFGVMSFAGE